MTMLADQPPTGTGTITTDSLQEPLLATSTSTTNNNEDDNDNNKNVKVHWSCGRRPPLIMNHNVLLNLLLCSLYGVSNSLWSGTVLAAYLKKMGHGKTENSWVGNVEAANGLAGLFSALPVGYLADTIGRDTVLKAGGVLVIVTAMMHTSLLQWIGVDGDDSDTAKPPAHTEIYLALIMGLWGIVDGMFIGPSQALFADSTPVGQRSHYYVYLFVCYLVASSLGPLVSIILFQTLGDDWDLYDLRLIIYVGMALEALNGGLMMLFDDSKALDEEEEQNNSDNSTEQQQRQIQQPLIETNCQTNGTENATGMSPARATDEERAEAIAATTTTTTTTNDYTDSVTKKRQAWIPYILFFHSLVFALGSGMTVKFFPLFFKDEVGMTPTHVQIVYFIVPLVMAGCSGLGQRLADRGGLGRVPTGLLFKLLGVCGLFSMVIFKSFLDSHPLLLVPIYIIRTALMNASYPLEESILMDFVPKQERARWKSLESISSFGWCGSAALGGWASDHANGDYTYTFLITACIQLVGCLCWASLLPLVPIKEGRDSEQSTPSSSFQLSSYNFDDTAIADQDDDGPGEEAIALAAKFPTLDAHICARFHDEFEGDDLLQKLEEYVQFRDMYNLDSLKEIDFLERPTDDAADWKWASDIATQAAKTREGSLIPGVKGPSLSERLCKWDQLPQLVFAPRHEDDTIVCSHEGNPIITYMAGRLDLDHVAPEVYALAISLYLEIKSYTHSFDTQGAILLVDTRKGRGWPNHKVFSMMEFLQVLAMALHKTHAGRVEKFLIYPVPSVGVYAWKMVKGWLPPEVAETIVLIRGGDGIDEPPPKDKLLPFVSDEVLNMMEETRRSRFLE